MSSPSQFSGKLERKKWKFMEETFYKHRNVSFLPSFDKINRGMNRRNIKREESSVSYLNSTRKWPWKCEPKKKILQICYAIFLLHNLIKLRLCSSPRWVSIMGFPDTRKLFNFSSLFRRIHQETLKTSSWRLKNFTANLKSSRNIPSQIRGWPLESRNALRLFWWWTASMTQWMRWKSK